MSKFYKYLLLIAWFTVGFADTQKLVAQNQVQTFSRHFAYGIDNTEIAFSSERIAFKSSHLEIPEDSNARGIYFPHQIVKGETAVRKSMKYNVYRSK